MKTKKITLLISMLFTFVVFAAPAFAYDPLTDDPLVTGPVLWWDILDTYAYDNGGNTGSGAWVGDLQPDTDITLAAGDTLRANLYISGIADPEYGLRAVDGSVTYTNPGMFDTMTLDDTHLHSDFENLRLELVTPIGTVYQRGGYILGAELSGNDGLILGEYDWMGIPLDGYDYVGLQLTANETITSNANITLNLDEFLIKWEEGNLPHTTIDLTINAVPVPAAIWLIGSAMLCILGINQRKRN